jgi:hypothetical protein
VRCSQMQPAKAGGDKRTTIRHKLGYPKNEASLPVLVLSPLVVTLGKFLETLTSKLILAPRNHAACHRRWS